MPEGNLVGRLGGDFPNLAQLIDPLLLGKTLLIGRLQAEVDTLAGIIVFIHLQHIQVEGDGELGVRSGTYEHVPGNLGGIDLKHVIQVNDLPRRRGNLSPASFDRNKIILEGDWSMGTKDLHDLLAGVEATALAVVVLACGFKVHPFPCPAHRPVNSPGELGTMGGAQVNGLRLASAVVTIGDTPLPIPIQDGGGILVGKAAEYGDRPPVVTQRCGTVFVQDSLDLGAVLQSGAHALCIHGGTVPFSLIQIFWLNTYDGKDLLHVNLVATGIVVRTAGGVWNQGNGFAQVCLQQLGLGHVLGHLAEHIIVIP